MPHVSIQYALLVLVLRTALGTIGRYSLRLSHGFRTAWCRSQPSGWVVAALVAARHAN